MTSSNKAAQERIIPITHPTMIPTNESLLLFMSCDPFVVDAIVVDICNELLLGSVSRVLIDFVLVIVTIILVLIVSGIPLSVKTAVLVSAVVVAVDVCVVIGMVVVVLVVVAVEAVVVVVVSAVKVDTMVLLVMSGA